MEEIREILKDTVEDLTDRVFMNVLESQVHEYLALKSFVALMREGMTTNNSAKNADYQSFANQATLLLPVTLMLIQACCRRLRGYGMNHEADRVEAMIADYGTTN